MANVRGRRQATVLLKYVASKSVVPGPCAILSEFYVSFPHRIIYY